MAKCRGRGEGRAVRVALLYIGHSQRSVGQPIPKFMPLFDEAFARIRANLEELQKGNRPRIVAVGTLTDVQLEAVNKERRVHGYSLMVSEILFVGRHVYQSRVERDGYSIDDVLDQIASGMEAASVVLTNAGMTAMENPTSRTDRYGNSVRDRIVLECSARHPRPELFSVVPKGDRIKPKKPST